MPIRITQDLQIPDGDLTFAFVRSSGPGGQNVNKVASAVQLRFDLAAAALDERVKQRLRALAGRRLTDDGAILILARTHRTQERNRADACERLAELVRRALIEPRPRRPTRPTRASRAARVDTKTRRGREKRLRSRVGWNDS
ncbi:MAG: alternative ribosome rescue aminoacyl-tRNA hydrolase ArfB [Steroidobacteraceae bacterium]